MIKVRVPTPLQQLTGGKKEVELPVCDISVRELVEKLEEAFPGVRERLLDEGGTIRRFINFYVNDEDIRFLEEENTHLRDGDVVSIVPAIAGGETDAAQRRPN
ncbi:MAG TPA: MoaD/ThiS family protein [Candidatus Latescibacteria bacterium]|nr:MoaD/ThiS family protein [Candidatus Latescibacterota bacterium]